MSLVISCVGGWECGLAKFVNLYIFWWQNFVLSNIIVCMVLFLIMLLYLVAFAVNLLFLTFFRFATVFFYWYDTSVSPLTIIACCLPKPDFHLKFTTPFLSLSSLIFLVCLHVSIRHIIMHLEGKVNSVTTPGWQVCPLKLTLALEWWCLCLCECLFKLVHYGVGCRRAEQHCGGC